MNVLFVEDDEVKRGRVSKFLAERIPQLNLDTARSLQSGIRKVKQQKYGLVILDMTLPNYDPGPNEPGGRPQLFGGREFLRQMDRFEITTPVILVTQFAAFGKGASSVTLADLDRELRQDHKDIYVGAIYYNAVMHRWENELDAMLSKILEKGQSA